MHEQDQRNVVDPTSYAQWYSTLPEEHLPYYYTPAQYYQWYYYSQVNPLNYTSSNYPQHGQNVHQNKQKLSRNQKRKLKKKELEQEYEKEKKQLGKWVDLERKDLVDQIKKIDEKELKIKEKKKEKLSHLIQIHKEVYKHMLKKNRGRIGRNEQVGNFRRKKKKPSHIKRMKQLYEEIKDKVKEPRKDEPRTRDEKASNEEQRQEDYVTESQSQNEGEQRVGQMTEARVGIRNHGTETERNKQEEAMRKQIKVIEYKRVGKLNGCVYNGITLREWVDHVPSTKLEDIVLRLINRLAYKQAIKKITHPEKARKSIIAGFHECRRTLWTKIDKKKSKLLVVALNIERNNFERGTDDQLQQVLWYAQEAEVPVIHISTRSKIGRAFTGKFGPRIAMVSVINYEGYQDMMEVVMEEWRELKKIYDTTNESMLKF